MLRLAALALLLPLVLQAQETPIKVRVLNGITGQPFRSVPVQVTPGTTATTDKEGVALFNLPPNATITTYVADLKSCSDHNPQGLLPDEKGTLIHTVRLSGVVAWNACGTSRLRPHPGEIVLYMEPRHWYKRLRFGA